MLPAWRAACALTPLLQMLLVCSSWLLTHGCSVRARQEFFVNIKDPGTVDGQWFQGVKKNMTRMITLRKIQSGEAFDNSANELYLDHIKAIMSALSRADSGGAL